MKSKSSRITFLEKNAALYKEVAQLQEKVRNMRIASNTLTKSILTQMQNSLLRSA